MNVQEMADREVARAFAKGVATSWAETSRFSLDTAKMFEEIGSKEGRALWLKAHEDANNVVTRSANAADTMEDEAVEGYTIRKEAASVLELAQIARTSYDDADNFLTNFVKNVQR